MSDTKLGYDIQSYKLDIWMAQSHTLLAFLSTMGTDGLPLQKSINGNVIALLTPIWGKPLSHLIHKATHLTLCNVNIMNQCQDMELGYDIWSYKLVIWMAQSQTYGTFFQPWVLTAPSKINQWQCHCSPYTHLGETPIPSQTWGNPFNIM